MVQTRSMARGRRPVPRVRRPVRRAPVRRRWIKRYRPSDRSKRHRLADAQPKTQRVVSYTRRT